MKNALILLMLIFCISCYEVGKLENEDEQAEQQYCGSIFDFECNDDQVNCHSYERDDRGNIVKDIVDVNCDGVTIFESESFDYVYDANDNIISKKITDLYDDETYCSSYQYDKNNNLVKYEYDQGCDGISVDCYTILEVDSHGNTTKALRDSSCHSESGMEYCYNIIYDAAGNMLSWQSDIFCDGSLDGCHVYTYDEEGRLLTEKSGCEDEKRPLCIEYLWDC